MTEQVPQQNLHATGLVVGARGIAIFGPSGAGKSALALELLRRAPVAGVFACLVADDRIWVEARSGRVVMRAPPPIAGLMEIRGHGPCRIGHLAAAVLDRCVGLVAEGEAPRLAAPGARHVAGLQLPSLSLARGRPAQAAESVLAWLAEPV